MTTGRWKFTGARLVPGLSWLTPLRVENLARFRFFRERVDGSCVLDLGCGAGEGTAFLAQEADWKVVGVDLSSDALEIAQQEYGASRATFLKSDVRHLPFRSGQFDAVISVEVIEHLDDPQVYIREAARMLQPNGLFMVTTPNRLRSSLTPGSLWPEHMREYSPEELISLLQPLFSKVELWGEDIPVYESHPIRRLARRLAPWLKPVLPKWARVRALPILQAAIRSNLEMREVRFAQNEVHDAPTIVALCC